MLNKSRTLLGIGPMSKCCIDACLELSLNYKFPLMFISSRRQIDSKELGGGYVNNWSTEEYSEYVLKRNKDAILARDHGGPWQNTLEIEKKLNKEAAIKSAKKSFEIDILSGFKVIHVDPSISEIEKLTHNSIMDVCFELIEHCWSFARQNNKDICFEIGTEEQTGLVATIEEFEDQIIKINKFCSKNNIDLPLYVVAQTGTRVIETRNIGTFNHPVRVSNELPPEIQIPKILEVCNRNNIFLKQHNTDYLEQKTLEFCPLIGIHAANVAPEFGVAETKAIFEIAKKIERKDIKDKMIDLIYKSNKWVKWMAHNSNASREDKAIIAGHYLFNDKEFVNLRDELKCSLLKNKQDIDKILKEEIKIVILKYLKSFRMI